MFIIHKYLLWSSSLQLCIAWDPELFAGHVSQVRSYKYASVLCIMYTSQKKTDMNTQNDCLEKVEFFKILLMEEILHQLINSLSHDLQGFIHLRWCRISSINSMAMFGINSFDFWCATVTSMCPQLMCPKMRSLRRRRVENTTAVSWATGRNSHDFPNKKRNKDTQKQIHTTSNHLRILRYIHIFIYYIYIYDVYCWNLRWVERLNLVHRSTWGRHEWERMHGS